MTHLRLSGLVAASAAGIVLAGATFVVSPVQAHSELDALAVDTPATQNAAVQQPCKFGSATNRMRAAMVELQREGRGEFRDSYAGVRVCKDPARVLVYRKPDRAFDRTAQRIAKRHRVGLQLVEAKASYAEMVQSSRQVENRRIRLKNNGALLQFISREPEGNVRVGVRGDVEAARRVLRDIAHVIVEEGWVSPK